ncbi:MAG TPA: diaminopimelate decarboxylase [Alphaproteobacteria bacterium]|nr:diaminopimelate decarboxylase [Alphaproteobacteria bacterium]HCY48052.1 diaminopimelate decarboxylase [Alphaproteobacteria bacterium]
MDHFSYKNGLLHAEDVPLNLLAKEVGTPFYVYSDATLTRHYEVFAQGFYDAGVKDLLVAFAVKANSNIAVLKTLAQLGAGADVVSGGELARALTAGIPPERIVFSGVGKTRPEIARALEVGIHMINVESVPELKMLSQVAQSMGLEAPVSLRINPDVDAKTHEKISTGKKENKFGINIDEAMEAFAIGGGLKGLKMCGVDMHIGSQLTALEPFTTATDRLLGLVASLKQEGFAITHLDLGGGLGIPYEQPQTENAKLPPSPSDYAKVIAPRIKDLDVAIAFEPGRLIAGNAGLLVASVIFEKTTAHKNFLIVDGAMNDLIRPSLYDAHHEIVPVLAADDAHLVDVVGPVCETGDIFGKDRQMPRLAEGDLIAIRSAGAYAAVMASEYNTRPLVPEVMVKAGQWSLIRRRPSFEEMIERESFASWQDENIPSN